MFLLKISMAIMSYRLVFVCFPKHSVVALSVIKVVVTRVMVKAILLIKFVSFLAFCSLAHPLFGEKVSEGFLGKFLIWHV